MTGQQDINDKALEQISQYILAILQQQLQSSNSNALQDIPKQGELLFPANAVISNINPRSSFYSVNNLFANDQDVKNPSLAKKKFITAMRNSTAKSREMREGETIGNQRVQSVIDLMSNTNDQVRLLLDHLFSKEQFNNQRFLAIKEMASRMSLIPASIYQIFNTYNNNLLHGEIMEGVERLREMALELNSKNAQLLDERALFRSRLFHASLLIRELKEIVAADIVAKVGDFEQAKLTLIDYVSQMYRNCGKSFSAFLTGALQSFTKMDAVMRELIPQESNYLLDKINIISERVCALSIYLRNYRAELNRLKLQLNEQHFQYQHTLGQLQAKLIAYAEENEMLKKSLEGIEKASCTAIHKMERELEAVKEENKRLCEKIKTREEADLNIKEENRELREKVGRLDKEIKKDKFNTLNSTKNVPLVQDFLIAKGTTVHERDFPLNEKENKKAKVCQENPSAQSPINSFYLAFAGLSTSHKSKLIGIATLFSLECNDSPKDFSPRITHLVCPPGYRSLRVLAAAVSCKWNVSTDWLLDSEKEGKLVEFEKYASRHKVSPLQGQFFYMTPQFESALNNKSLPGLKMAVDRVGFLNLLCELGRARLKEQGEGIPLVLDNTSQDSPPNGMTWSDLVELIMSF